MGDRKPETLTAKQMIRRCLTFSRRKNGLGWPMLGIGVGTSPPMGLTIHAPSCLPDDAVLDGVLPLGLSFPGDFGFVSSTFGADGDPLDVLVLADESIPIGAVVPCRLVCAIEAS